MVRIARTIPQLPIFTLYLLCPWNTALGRPQDLFLHHSYPGALLHCPCLHVGPYSTGFQLHVSTIPWQACMLCFFKGQGHQGIFSLVKGTLWGNCKFLLKHFKSTRGHGGNCLRCLREVSGLPWGFTANIYPYSRVGLAISRGLPICRGTSWVKRSQYEWASCYSLGLLTMKIKRV